MGDPRKLKNKFQPPKHPWIGARVEHERRLVDQFGLRNKKEIWRAEAFIRKYRHLARALVGVPIEERKEQEKAMIAKLQKIGLLKQNATLDDILSLKVEDLLERRLQTIVWKKGLAATSAQARQLVVHGHVKLNNVKTTVPSTVVNISEENTVEWHGEPLKVMALKVVEKPKAKKAKLKAGEVEPEEVKEIEEVKKIEAEFKDIDKKIAKTLKV